jgi:hypothetical protein
VSIGLGWVSFFDPTYELAAVRSKAVKYKVLLPIQFYSILPAPPAECLFLTVVLDVVPRLKQPPPVQQSFVPGVCATSTKHLSDLAIVIRQMLLHELKDQIPS